MFEVNVKNVRGKKGRGGTAWVWGFDYLEHLPPGQSFTPAKFAKTIRGFLTGICTIIQ